MSTTREVIEQLYDAYLSGDVEGLLALLDDEVEVRFLGQAIVHGRDAARDFFAFAGPLLRDVEFRVERIIVEGAVGAGVWSETARTADGHPWRNHGVDVVHVREGRIIALHENNDTRLVHRHLPPYRPSS
jgi:ketosteroid isomerase-like protein